MNNETQDYDNVRVFFKDGTSTLLIVLWEDNIVDAIIELCENEGWPFEDVIDHKIEE